MADYNVTLIDKRRVQIAGVDDAHVALREAVTALCAAMGLRVTFVAIPP